MSDNLITLQEAYSAATEFFKTIQSKTTIPEETQLALEEFELVKSKSLISWFVTLRFVSIQQDHNYNDECRIFKVNAVTKEIESMQKGFMGHQEDSTIGGIFER